jgi:hypothetical protein
MSVLAVNSVTDANGGNTATINSMTPTADSLQGFRNRIINGDCRIDQRNAGAAVTINTGANIYTLDRWNCFGATADGVYTVDQVTDAPAGFVNSAKITVTTADASIGSDQSYAFNQFIEGTNTADLAWGTASAKTITISFWVRSSVTGTFGGALNNSGNVRGYAFTYTISSADTWEYKTVTIAGDTGGTWLTDTGRGVTVRFSFGAGSNRVATAGSWNGSGTVYGASGQTQLISTLNATWYITGVQLEVGSVATPFERRPYGAELVLCYRYFFKYENTTGVGQPLTVWQAFATDAAFGSIITFPVVMRAAPTATTSGTFFLFNANGSSINMTAFTIDRLTSYTAGSNSSNVASGLVAGNATGLYAPNNGSISLSAEL